VSAAQRTAPDERRLRLIDGGVSELASRAALRQAFTFRPPPSNAALALTDDDHLPPPRPRLHLVGDPADAPADPFDVPAEGAPLGAGREPVWLEEFLERAAAVLRERPRSVQQLRLAPVRDELARIRHLRPIRSSAAEHAERDGADRCNVVELRRHGHPRPAGRSRC
jgi:hypothetical protein